MSFWRRRRRTEVSNFNLASEVERRARNESRSAFAFVDEAGIIERHGYGDVSRHATRWASLLAESGVRPGDRVLVLAGRRIEWPSALLGVMKVGAVAVPCPASLDADELDARAADSEAVLVVSAGATASALTLPTLDADEERARLDAQPLATPTYPADGRDPALILYSRGRGVVHTHASCRAQALPAELWLDLREGDRVWCTAEPGTTDSILSLLGAWMLGAEWLLHEDTPDADGRLELIDQAGVTVLWQTAAEYEGMSAVERPHWYDLSRVRTAVTTGEPLSVEEGDRFLVTFAIPVLAGWGQAETGIVIGERRGSASRPGTIGLALGEVDVAVVDERGQELPIGVEGELAVRGRPPGLFDRYWNAQRETAAALRKDVYFTGIGASRDDAGHIRLVERQPPVVVSLPERRRRDAARLAEEQRTREAEERRVREADERRREEETRLAEVSAAEERLARRQEQNRQAAERAEQERLKADERARRSQERQQQREARHAEKAERERLKVERRVEQERIRREQDEARRAAKLARREAASAQKQEQEQAEQRSRDEAEARAAKERAAAEQRRREEEEARLAQEQAAAQAREQEQARQAALERERAAAEQRRREEEEARLAQEQAAAQAREQEQARQAALERERAAAEAEARERADRAAAERQRLDEERERVAAAAVAAEARRREARAQAEAAEERERQAAAERKRAEEERRREEERERAAAEAKLREQARAEAEARERAERAAAAERRRQDDERRRREAETKGRRRTETRLRRSKPPATPPKPELAESEEPDTVHHGLLDRMRAYGISVTPPEDANPSADEPDEKRERAS